MSSGAGMSAARALWYAAPRRAELREASLSALSGEQALVTTSWSGISRGTERLIFEGRVPTSEFNTMRAPLQDGSFPFPVKYGYCAVGTVSEGPADLKGRMVFCLHPHQDRFVAPVGLMVPVPDTVPARRAILSANMETALNALWDAGGDAGIAPKARVAVVGAGIVGLLVGFLAAHMSACHVTVVDVASERQQIAESLGVAFAYPEAAPRDVDLVFHTSSSAAGLATAIGLAGFEARIIEMSWYGEGTVAVPLGGAFHSRRLQLISSQVGHVAPSHRAGWTHRQRLAKAVELLADSRLDALITEEVTFESLPAALPRILAPGASGLATAIRY
jgi:2-desacetyl-2-hydroxyethyl bacteriochlorophyllide A dehydrogenase